MLHSDVRNKRLLNDRDLSTAISELNEPEDTAERLKKIDNLRNAFIKQNINSTSTRIDDLFILRFLRASKFDHDQALSMMISYHTEYLIWPEVVEKAKNPLSIKHVYDAGCFVALRGKAKDGSTVCIGRPGKVKNPIYTEFVALGLVTLEHLLKDDLVQIHGISVIEDLSYVELPLMRQLSPKLLKRLFKFLSTVMPLRLKKIHFVNEPLIAHLFISMVGLFLKEKRTNVVTFNGKNFAQLQETVDQSVLPPTYGGNGQTLDELVDWWRNTIFD